jgi:serine/threonine-protein kinase
MSSPVNCPEPVKVGEILAGKYVVERVLGVGGMGIVVAAKHLTLGERVAIKFLRPEAFGWPDVLARFLREGQAAARLRGEHVARVYDVGKLDDGAPFLVMEYLDGADLGRILRDDGPLSVETAVRYTVETCEALAEAHAMGIIHRDLKPTNLFVVHRLDGSPTVKLIDFGISKLVAPDSDVARVEMTQTAMTMGSPSYMSPEQMVSARDVDVRTDIWSIGILLHAMLVGAPPFQGASPVQIYQLMLKGAPPIRSVRPDVPEGVEAVILTCLQRDRALRYGNVGEVADALASFGPPQLRVEADRILRILAALSLSPAERTGPLPRVEPSSAEGYPVGGRTPTPGVDPSPEPRQEPVSLGARVFPPELQVSLESPGSAESAVSRGSAAFQGSNEPRPMRELQESQRRLPTAEPIRDAVSTDGEPLSDAAGRSGRRSFHVHREVIVAAALVALAVAGSVALPILRRTRRGATDMANSVALSDSAAEPTIPASAARTATAEPTDSAQTFQGAPTRGSGVPAPSATAGARSSSPPDVSKSLIRSRRASPEAAAPARPANAVLSGDDLFRTQK